MLVVLAGTLPMDGATDNWLQFRTEGMYHLGSFNGQSTNYRVYEIPIFLFMGLAGGLIGATFNATNRQIAFFRRKHMTRPWHRLVESVCIAIIMAICGFWLPSIFQFCAPVPQLTGLPAQYVHLQQFNCKDGEYNEVASYFHNTWEARARVRGARAVHACGCGCVCARVYLRACVRACVCVRVCCARAPLSVPFVSVYACVCLCMRACVRARTRLSLFPARCRCKSAPWWCGICVCL